MSEKYCSTCGVFFKTFDKDILFCNKCLPEELKKRGKDITPTCPVCMKQAKEDDNWVYMTYGGMLFGINYCRCHLVCALKNLKKEVESANRHYKKLDESAKIALSCVEEAKQNYENFVETYKTELVVEKL